jgi:hypothetical protein
VCERFVGFAVKNQLAAHQDNYFVKKPDVFHRVRRQNHRSARFGYLPKQPHYFLFGRRVKPGFN